MQLPDSRLGGFIGTVLEKLGDRPGGESDFGPGGGDGIKFDPFSQDAQVVPEPASLLIWSLIGLSVAGFAWMRRK